MKINLTTLCLLLCIVSARSQTAITSVDTSSSPATISSVYNAEGNKYSWGFGPYNSMLSLKGFTAGGTGYSYVTNLAGNVRLRRVNNAKVSGNFTLEWVQTVTTDTTFNLFTAYQNNMESFLNDKIFNKGTDNLFDNTSTNSNDIERFDWILSQGGYSTFYPAQVGFAVFDKGTSGTHDPFCIAAITSLDIFGNPLTYGNILRVTAANYGNSGPSITYRVVKAQFPSNLVDAGTNTQSLGGVFISFQDLGVVPNTTIYGYSLFGNDLPVSATPANLVNYNDSLYFPLRTNTTAGGLDLVAVSGITITNSLLPVSFLNFKAVENNNNINLKWNVENETPYNYYDVERSEDGVHYEKINQVRSAGASSSNSYSLEDNVTSVTSKQLYYRIKKYESNGSFSYSKSILVRRNNLTSVSFIWPNPVKENLYINMPSTANINAVISVINASGSRVLLQNEQLFKGNNSFSINGVSKLSKGLYQLRIYDNYNKTITKQFLKL